MSKVKALIIVDIQNDFCEGGSLAVEGGTQVAKDVTEFIKKHREDYGAIVATRDWHITPGSHFASYTLSEPNFQSTWPDHCVAHTEGAEYHPALELPPETVHVRKGQNEAAYSGFEGTFYDPWNDVTYTLKEYLNLCEISEVDIVGIATDYCVAQTAFDAIDEGYAVTVIGDLTAAVNPSNKQTVLNSFTQSEMVVINSSELG